jgi:hypothetical protein
VVESVGMGKCASGMIHLQANCGGCSEVVRVLSGGGTALIGEKQNYELIVCGIMRVVWGSGVGDGT